MGQENVLFVLGAGSNLEHGFLLGSALKLEVQKRLSVRPQPGGLRNDYSEFLQSVMSSETWKSAGFDRASAAVAAQFVSEKIGHVDSIDEFLFLHQDRPDVVHLGKLAIVDTIRTFEQNSYLASNRAKSGSVPIGLKEGAYREIWRKMKHQLTASDLRAQGNESFSHLSFITFNYDRSLEQFLFWAIGQTYALEDRRAAEIVRNLNLHHVYGSIGQWGFGRADRGESVLPFGFDGVIFESVRRAGSEPSRRVFDLATYTEQIDNRRVEVLRSLVSQADQIYFIGMGYHEQNLKLLLPTGGLKARVIAGTAEGVSPLKCQLVRQFLERSSLAITNIDDSIVSERSTAALFRDYLPAMNGYLS